MKVSGKLRVSEFQVASLVPPARPGNSELVTRNSKLMAVALCGITVLVSGCGIMQKAKQADVLKAELEKARHDQEGLQRQREALQAQLKAHDEELARLNAEHQRLQQEKQQAVEQVDELAEAKERLARDLQRQIGEYQAKLTLTERGLVITFLAEILFDSGKAVVKPEGYEVLDKVSEVLATTVENNRVAVEGHTDNDPIKHSGWKSNWELSAHRALAVLHYFVDARGLPPERFQAVGYGEYHPVGTNDTDEGRLQNRRVEVVILPKQLTKVKPST